MRAVNILIGTIATLWLAIFVMSRDIIYEVSQQGYSTAPSAGQIDYYIIYPLVAVVLLLFVGWVANVWQKSVIALAPALIIGFMILPFLLGFTGGM